MSKLNFFEMFWVLFVILLYMVIYGYIFDEKINLNGDNIGYYAMGKNIADGKGFSYAYDHSAARQNEPVGYPILIACFLLISDDMNLLSLVNGLLMLGSLLLLIGISQRLGLPKGVWIITSLFIIFNPSIMQYAYIHMSEGPYLFFSLLGVYLFILLRPERPYERQAVFYFMALVLLIMYFTRTAGLVLLLSVVIYLSYQKKYIASLILAGLFIITIGVWNLNAPASNRYLQVVTLVNPYNPSLGKLNIKSAAGRFVSNLDRYTGKEIPSVIFPFLKIEQSKPAKAIHYIIGIAVALSTLFGLWFKFPKQPVRLLIFLYLAGSITMLLLWPTQWFGSRFITPLIPLSILFGIKGLFDSASWFADKMRRPYIAWTPWALLITLPLFFGTRSGRQVNTNTVFGAHLNAKTKYPPAYQRFFDLGHWARTNLPPNAVVASRKPTLFYYTSRGYTCYYPTTSRTTVEFMKGLKESKATHLVMEELGYKTTPYLTFFINNLPQNFQLLYTIPGPDTKIYKILYPQ